MSNDIDVFYLLSGFYEPDSFYSIHRTPVFVDGTAKIKSLSIESRLFVDGTLNGEKYEQKNCNPGYQGLFS